MSTDLIQLDEIIVNSFFGGIKRGQCLQFTPLQNDYAQMTREEVVMLRDALSAWLDEPKDDRLTALEQAAAKDSELLTHIKDVLIGRGFSDPLVQEIQAHMLNKAALLPANGGE